MSYRDGIAVLPGTHPPPLLEPLAPLIVPPGSLYFQQRVAAPPPTPGCIHWSPLDDLPYIAYDAVRCTSHRVFVALTINQDFGPSHIAHICQFTKLLNNKLETGSVVEVYCHGQKDSANCVVLLGCYLVRPPYSHMHILHRAINVLSSLCKSSHQRSLRCSDVRSHQPTPTLRSLASTSRPSVTSLAPYCTSPCA